LEIAAAPQKEKQRKKPCREICSIHGGQSSGYLGTTKKLANIIVHSLVFVKEVIYNSNAVRDLLGPDVYGGSSPAQAVPVFAPRIQLPHFYIQFSQIHYKSFAQRMQS